MTLNGSAPAFLGGTFSARLQMVVRLFIASILFAMTGTGPAQAHPEHSEAIERPCRINTKNEQDMSIEGQCSFFVTGGYLVFTLDVQARDESADTRTISGAINLALATGSAFISGGDLLADGDVSLALQTPEIVHIRPGPMAQWDNGTVLVAAGPAEAVGTAGKETAFARFSRSLSNIMPSWMYLKMPAPLTLISLGLLVGLHGAKLLRFAWPAFFCAMLVGLAVSMGFDVFVDPALPMLWLALFAGVYAASGISLAPSGACGLAGLCGFFTGLFISSTAAPWLTQVYGIAGRVISANLTLVVVAGVIGYVRTRWSYIWVLIGLRIIASWLAAIAAIMTALLMQ